MFFFDVSQTSEMKKLMFKSFKKNLDQELEQSSLTTWNIFLKMKKFDL
jgi:hypothetical protein